VATGAPLEMIQLARPWGDREGSLHAAVWFSSCRRNATLLTGSDGELARQLPLVKSPEKVVLTGSRRPSRR